MPKLHETWPGRNYFICCVMTGPIRDILAHIYIYVCVLGAVIPFSVVMFNSVWKIAPVIPILFYISAFCLVLFLNLTACSDPGIIPRRNYLMNQPEKYSKYLQQNSQKTRRFCRTCKIYKPRRASHCSTCNNCVRVFDHHCGFVGNCIGQRNYRYFFLFLAFICLTIIFFMVNVIIYATSGQIPQSNGTIAIVICSIILGLMALQLFGFFGFHCYIAITGSTTREVIKGKQQWETQQNQWCCADEPMVDYFSDISEEEMLKIKNDLRHLEDFKPDSQNQ